MAWTGSHEWPGLPTGLDGLQYLRFGGLDRETGYIWYKLEGVSNTLAVSRKFMKLGGDRYQVHIFCGDNDIFDAVSAVIHNHPDAHKDYAWTLKGPTWFNTNKLIMCHRVDEFIVECEREYSVRINDAGPSGKLQLRIEIESGGERHCFIQLRRFGTDFDDAKQWAVDEAQGNIVMVKEFKWPVVSGVVRGKFQAAGLVS